MSIKSKREKCIKAYIEATPNCSLGKTKRLEIEGQAQELPIYRLPIKKLLVFNVENGRFAADLYTIEKNLGRKLNPWNPQDSNLIKKILLERYPGETKRLRSDLEKVGQLEVGVITSAGVVINGNRRMAILIELCEKTSNDKYAYLETVMLPHHLNEEEIYKIEARLQYAKDFKIDYGPVNELLKMRAGIDKGMSKRELANVLGREETYIAEHLEQLDLLEDYSKYALKGKVDYKKMEDVGITEHMDAMQKNLKKYRNEGAGPSEIKKYIEIHFAYTKSGCTFDDIRRLSKINLYKPIKAKCKDALARFKERKIHEETFKELIDDTIDELKIRDQSQIPPRIIQKFLTNLKRLHDEKIEITPEIKKYLQEMKKIIHEMLTRK